MATVCVRIVADLKAQTFQFITKLCSKIQTLYLAQNLQLFLQFVVHRLYSFRLIIRSNTFNLSIPSNTKYANKVKKNNVVIILK